MAVTATEITALSGENTKVFAVEATADGDTTVNITHGFGETPQVIFLTPTAAAARVSLWCATVINSTIITLTKATTAGSGAVGEQVRVIVSRQHSMVR